MIAAYTEGDEPVPGFRLAKLLAYETFGSVWKATGPGGMEACVKIVSLVNKKQLKEFTALRLVKHVRHPNLVPILAFWLKDRQGNFIDERLVEDADSLPTHPMDLIMVMGLGDLSLFDRLKQCQAEGFKGLPPRELLSYMDDVAAALDHLNRPIHDLGAGPSAIQHCDIKPQNILIVGSAAQICDLGGARIVDDLRTTSAVGSAAYMAPEFITEGRPSRATDQYSLAICYVELRTGSLPLNAKSAAAAYFTHIRGALDLAQLSPAERAVVVRATAVRSDNRFPTCSSFVRSLRQACGLTEETEPTAEAAPASNINELAPRGYSPSMPAVNPKEEVPEPSPAAPCEEPSDESVNLAAPPPPREDNTLTEGMSFVSNGRPLLLASPAELARTAVVEVHVVQGMDTPVDEDEAWPVPSAAATQFATAEAPATVAENQGTWPNSRNDLDIPLAATPQTDDERNASPPPTPAAPRAGRRWRLSLPLAVASSACLGLCASWFARQAGTAAPSLGAGESSPAPASKTADQATHAAIKSFPPRLSEPQPQPVEASPRLAPLANPASVTRLAAAPFVLTRDRQAFDTLAAAIQAARPGDTVEIQGDGPFDTEALEIQGKELTLQAAPGAHPRLLLRSRTNRTWQPLIVSDRALTIAGLILRRKDMSSRTATAGAAPLAATNGAPLRLIGCQLELPGGSAAVLCRNPGKVELIDCAITTAVMAVCVEVGDGSACEIHLAGNTFSVHEPGSAAISIWAPEVSRPAPVELCLEGNTIAAGRIAALTALPGRIDLDARANHFTFRDAFLSYAGGTGPQRGWQATAWREHDNTYQGAGEWLLVEGRSGGIHDEGAWRAFWNLAVDRHGMIAP